MILESTDVSDIFGLSGVTLEGRFVVDRPIAEGGFGVVYRAQQAALDRPVALKVLKTPPRFDEVAKQQFLASFATEARTIARITHPNIVLVYDFGVSVMPSGHRAAWMALEWLTGVTLDADLAGRRGQGGRSPAECLQMLRPALSALAVVHAAGVAHRDLKPANIMLVPTPDGTTPKLLDFGIAKIMEANESPGSGNTRTSSNQIAFSPGYASPEQISQGRSGPWTDVHAMALIVTEMLTDRAPLEGEETAILFQQIVDRVRPTPGKFGVDVGAWEAVLRRALAVSPVERCRDARELLQALDASLGEATSSRTSDGSLARVSSPDRPSGSTTLGVMSTWRAGSTSALQPRAKTTTSTPVSDDVHVLPLTRSPRVPLYIVGGAAILACAGFVWRAATTTHAGAAPTVSPAPQLPAAPTPTAAVTASVGQPPPVSASAVPAASSSGATNPHPPSGQARTTTNTATKRPASSASPAGSGGIPIQW